MSAESPRFTPLVRLLLYCLCGGALSVVAGGIAIAALWSAHPTADPMDFVDRFPLLLSCATLVPLAAVAIAFARWVDRRSMAEFGLSLGERGGTLLGDGTTAGVFATCFIMLVLWLAGVASVTGWSPDVLLGGQEGIHRSFLGMLLLFGLQSASEEIVIRGYVLRNLLDRWSAPVAVVASSGVFGIAHVCNPEVTVFSVVNIVLIGIVFAVACLRTGSLWFAIGLHWAWNFWLAAGYSLPVSGFQLRGLLATEVSPIHGWLSGAEFGPEGGAVGTVAILLLGWAVVRLLPQREVPQPVEEAPPEDGDTDAGQDA